MITWTYVNCAKSRQTKKKQPSTFFFFAYSSSREAMLKLYTCAQENAKTSQACLHSTFGHWCVRRQYSTVMVENSCICAFYSPLARSS